MEVVGHERVGENLDTAVAGDLPELLAQDLLGRVIEEESPVHRSGHAVVDRIAGGGGGFDACGSHDGWALDGTKSESGWIRQNTGCPLKRF